MFAFTFLVGILSSSKLRSYWVGPVKKHPVGGHLRQQYRELPSFDGCTQGDFSTKFSTPLFLMTPPFTQADHPDRNNMQPAWKGRQTPAVHLSRRPRQAPPADCGRSHQGRRRHPAVWRGQLLEGRWASRLPHPCSGRPHWNWNPCGPSNEEVSWTNVNRSYSYIQKLFQYF